MVQVLPAVPKKEKKSFMEKLGPGFPMFLQGAMQFAGKIREEKKEQRELEKENESIKKNYDIDLSGITNPQTRHQIIANQLIFGKKSREAEASKNIDYSLNKETPQEREQFFRENKSEKIELPEFGETKEKGKLFSKKTKNKELGNIPQPETAGIKRSVFAPEQVLQKGRQIESESRAVGVPMSDLDGYNIANQMNEANKNYNSSVEADTQQRVQAQRQYGNIAVEKLKKVLPNATDEQEAIFKRKGEEAAAISTSEANIERDLAQDAVKFKNTIANVKKSIGPKRLFSGIKQSLLGTSRDFEKKKNDIRIKLKPLLDEGLYDTSRNLLSELGYHPEERESIITDLGEPARKIISQLPKMNKTEFKENGSEEYQFGGPASFPQPEFSEQVRKQIKDSLSKIVTADPSVNLILLRKVYEDKNVDWQTFKDDINDLIIEGKFMMDDDQFKHLDLLDTPPLDNLDKLLYGIKLIGR